VKCNAASHAVNPKVVPVRNRRLLSALALCAAVSVSATGCFATVGGDAGAGGTVVFSNTGGALAAIFADTAYKQLADQGIQVAEESPNNEAKLTAMVESGTPTWDVFYASPYRTVAKCDVLFEKLDMSRINTEGLDPALTSECGVPVLRSAFLLVYNADKYGDRPPQSWADFYDTANFPGTRGIMNYAKDAAIETALLASGVPGDQLYPLDYERAFATLDTIRPSARFYDTGAQQTQALESGEVDMMLAWPGRAYEATKNGANLKVVWNQPLYYTDSLGIVKGAPNMDEAYQLINALIDVPTQEEIMKRQPYGAANANARPSEDPLLNSFIATSNVTGTEVHRDNEWWAANLDEATRQWTDWVNR
jgi:putative spermidine/putrescine transport system substrate-binding protein